MSEHCPDTGRLLLYLAGELDDEGTRSVREHVSSCAQCATLATSLERLTGHLRESAPVPAVRSGECLETEALAAYADGTLPAQRADDVEAHLAGCDACLREVGDLMRLAGPAEYDAPDASVSRVLNRLSEDSRTAVVRWGERSLSVVRGFASAVASGLAEGVGAPAERAFAVARDGGASAALAWSGDQGSEVLGLLEISRGEVSLTGRVVCCGNGARAVSVSLSSDAGRRGPESPDGAGTFGPWPVERGRNVLRLTGLPESPRDPVELVLQVEDESGE